MKPGSSCPATGARRPANASPAPAEGQADPPVVRFVRMVSAHNFAGDIERLAAPAFFWRRHSTGGPPAMELSRPAAAAAASRPSWFERLAGWSYHHRWWALAAWAVVLAVVGVTAQRVGADYHNDFSLPGTQSQRALDDLRAHAPIRAGATVQIVVQDAHGVATPATRDRVDAMLTNVRGLPHVADTRSPYTDASGISHDGTIGYATVTLDAQAPDVPSADVRHIIDTARAAQGNGLRVELGGDAVVGAEKSGSGAAEGVGMVAALIILVLLFGSLLAAAVPIVIAVFAVGTAVGLLVLASH